MGYTRHKATGVRHAWAKLGEGLDGSWKFELPAGLLLAVCGYPRAIFGAEVALPQPGQQPVASVGKQFLAAAAPPPPPVPAGPGHALPAQHSCRGQLPEAQAKRCRHVPRVPAATSARTG